MDDSFFELNNDTMDVTMASVDEVIDNSVMEESFTIYRKPVNQTTAVVAESEESAEEVSSDEDNAKKMSKSDSATKSYINDEDDDMSELPQLKLYDHIDIATSSEDDISPELVPRRRPPNVCVTTPIVKRNSVLTNPEMRASNINERQKSLGSTDNSLESSKTVENDESFIGIRRKKILMIDSESDEYDEDEMVASAATRMSILGVRPKDMASDESDFIQSDDSNATDSKDQSNTISSENHMPPLKPSDRGEDEQVVEDNDISRLSCSPIGSPNKNHNLNRSNSETSLPEIHMPSSKPPDRGEDEQDIENNDFSRLSCSPIGSPNKDVSMNESHMTLDLTKEYSPRPDRNRSGIGERVLIDLTNRFDDDDVKVVETKQVVIDLSSDDETYETNKSKKSSKSRSLSPKIMKPPKKEQGSDDAPDKVKRNNTIKSYLSSVNPYQKVVYVKQSVRDNEMKKLNELKYDIQTIENLANMSLNTLPDNGLKLKQKLSQLKVDVKTQAEKVAAMLIEPDNPTAQDIARDGFGIKKDLTWDDIQAVSDKVQPRMFGKQATATHMAEKTLILDRLRDLHESLASRPSESSMANQPSKLTSKLMPHQLHALAWLKWRETQKPKGGILADDMGLGKTITMIALVLSSKNKWDDGDDEDKWKGKPANIRGGTLVVCPASLLQQWSGEVTNHCSPHALSVRTHHGAARDTRLSALASADLVLTTYNILQRDNEKKGVLMKIRWSRIILDEAHIVRNHKSSTSAAVSALNGDNRWCLTGTPVQNKDLDVFALLKFLKCTPFDDLTMWKKWIDNKSLGGQERLGTVMRCLLLRRTKLQLQEQGTLTCLPDRTLHKVEVTLSKEEMNVYQKVLVFSKTLFAQFLHQRAEKQADDGFMPKTLGKNDPYAKMHKKMVQLQGANPVKSHEILVLLLRLRQLCCHCGLIASMLDGTGGNYEDDDDAIDLLSELKKMAIEDKKGKLDDEEGDAETEGNSTVAEAIRSVLSPTNPVFNLERKSSKISAVIHCLKKNVFNKGEKAVIVSQWTSVLRLVEKELLAARISSVTLSGSVPVPKRAAIVDSFNRQQSNPQVMLLSLCAGGVGLNLCGGNHLLLLDPHWNPQLEQQAQDRIYRVGQTKPVHVYRFVTLETVEQSIRKLQEQKLELAESVLTGARYSNASKLSIEDLKVLFNMGQSSD